MDPISQYFLQKTGNTHQLPVILMYHGTVPGNSKQAFPYNIDTHRFEQQLDLLRKSGWTTARIKDLAPLNKWPSKTIILTFDDGFENNFDGAFRPLQDRGMSATFYVVSGRIGGSSTWLQHVENEKMLNRKQIRQMHMAGMEIGSHTVHHPDLNRLEREDTLAEVKRSKIELENIVGERVVSFAYPYGRYSDTTLNAVKEAGYDFACSVRPGRVRIDQDFFLLPRITIFAYDSLEAFARKIAFASNDASWGKILNYYKKRILKRLF